MKDKDALISVLVALIIAVLFFTFGCLIESEIVSHNPIYYCESCDNATNKTSEYCPDCGSKYKIINQGEN